MNQKEKKSRLRTADVPEEEEREDKEQSIRAWQIKKKIKNKSQSKLR